MPTEWNPAGNHTNDAHRPRFLHTSTPQTRSPRLLPAHPVNDFDYHQVKVAYTPVPVTPGRFVPILNPYASPWSGGVLLSPYGPDYPAYYRDHYMSPCSPYAVPLAVHANPFYELRIPRGVNPLIKDGRYVRLDLSLPSYSPHIPRHGGAEGYLLQDAVLPPLPKIMLACRAFGSFEEAWKTIVEPGHAVSIDDVLRAVHEALQTPLQDAEWSGMSNAEALVVSSAYTRRCRIAEFNQVKGMRRIDFLGEKFWFAGISKTGDGDAYSFELLVRSK